MLILALDTSGDICSLCLSEGARVRSVFDFRHERRLSERLPDAIRFLLSDGRVTLRDIDALAVGLGPGSFTGVRVGVTSAKTLAQVLERPLVGVDSLDAIAEPFRFLDDAGIVTLVHARRDAVVAAFFRNGERLAPPEVVAVDRLAERAADMLAGAKTRILCGEVDAYPVLEKAFGITRVQHASAACVATLAATRLERGEADDPLGMTPQYVAPTPVG